MRDIADITIARRRRGDRDEQCAREPRVSDAAGPSSSLAVGQVRCCSKLGSDASYRLVDVSGPLVEVEVLVAPGLRPGARFRLTRRAVLAMPLAGGAPQDI